MKRRAFVALIGVALAAPRRALAQLAPKAPRIAIVDPAEQVANMAEGRHAYWGALLAELKRLGHVEGRTIQVERWSGGGDRRTYGELGRKIVATRPQLIVARGRSTTAPIAAATKEIPIVSVGTIPAALRASYAHPGKNVTGIQLSSDQQLIYSKQMQFIRDVGRKNPRIAWLGPRSSWDSVVGEAAREGARQTGVALQPVLVADPIGEATLRRAFAEVAAGKFHALYVSPATELTPHSATIAALAITARLPTIGTGRLLTDAGLLLSYGADTAELWRRAAHYVDRILKGAKPGDLPIEQPKSIELIVNLKTAKAIGVKVPPPLLLRADRVIE